MTLKDLRLAKDMTQNEVADIVGVTQSAVHHWESGKAGVCRAKRERLARLYECEVEDITAAIVELRKERSETLEQRKSELPPDA